MMMNSMYPASSFITLVFCSFLLAFSLHPVDGGYAGNPSFVPEWFQDAIFGIFIHYGVYTVPAYAPLTDPFAYGSTTLADIRSGAPAPAIVNNTYAAWYWNSMSINGSSTQQYHQQMYGEKSYDDFFPVFDEESQKLNVAHWKEVIQSARANYAVLTSVHHDGYNLFPSEAENPHRNVSSLTRDVVADFMRAFRNCTTLLPTGPGNYCIEPGIYVSTGYRWEFNGVGFDSIKGSLEHILQTPEYSAYLSEQFDQLTRDYQPAYFWGDWGAPRNFDLKRMLDTMDATVGPKAMINDRFTQESAQSYFGLLPVGLGTPLRILAQEKFNVLSWEYKNRSTILNYSGYRFEMTRGVARDFSYNINENENDPYLLSARDILNILLMVSSNNGNFLLGITPMANGTIPSHQIRLLRATGRYLDVYGEAIFKTRPCASSDIPLRLHFTNDENANYGRFCSKSTITPDTYYLSYIQYKLNGTGLNEICVPPLSSIHNLFLFSYASTKVTNLVTGEVLVAIPSWSTAQFCIPFLSSTTTTTTTVNRSLPVTIKIQKK